MAINVDLHETIRMIVRTEIDAFSVRQHERDEDVDRRLGSLADAIASVIHADSGAGGTSDAEAARVESSEDSADAESDALVDEASEVEGELVIDGEGDLAEVLPIVVELTSQEALDEIEPERTHPFTRKVSMPRIFGGGR